MSVAQSSGLNLSQDLQRSIAVREVADPTAGFARVRLHWAGVCGSDLHVLRTGDWVSYWPAVLGHEGVGVVESCPGGELEIGTPVVVDSRVGCGQCSGCQTSPMLCDSLQWVGEVSPGTFQNVANFPVGSLVACPADIDMCTAVLAEPLAVALHAVALSGALPEHILILGFGPIGALVYSELRRQQPSAQIFVEEIHPDRIQLATAVGAHVVSPDSGLYPLVIDAAGYPGSFQHSLDAVNVGGTVTLVGIGHTTEIIRPQQIVEKSVQIHGSHGFTDELPDAVCLISESPEQYRWVISDAWSLDEFLGEVSNMLTQPTVGKAVLSL